MKRYSFGIEGGGTKFICGVGNKDGEVLERVSIPTTSPHETVEEIAVYYRHIHSRYDIVSVGAGCFGPLDLDPASNTFGFILSTPKREWEYFDIKGSLKKIFGLEIRLDTDVNAALVGEFVWGAGQGLSDLVYLTVGTGIGGGVLSGGKLVHGMLHPEIGHMFVPGTGVPPDFKGVCPYHGTCLEGLASGPAVEAMWG